MFRGNRVASEPVIDSLTQVSKFEQENVTMTIPAAAVLPAGEDWVDQGGERGNGNPREISRSDYIK
jgi:hypothetical protein